MSAGKSGQKSIVACDGLSAYDPELTNIIAECFFISNQFLTIRACRSCLPFEQTDTAMEQGHCGFTLAEVEREHILDALVCCHGNRTHTASLLDISLRGLRIKLHDYAQSGCIVCETNAHPDQFLCERAKSPLAPCRRR